MTHREIKYLARSNEFLEFINKYNLKLKIVDDEKIFLISKCFIFEIYGLVVEDFFYFDLYPIELNVYSNVDRLLSEGDSDKIQSIYQLQIATRKHVLISKLQGDKENTLKAEQCFFTMIQLMDGFLADVLSCKKSIDNKYCTEISDYKKTELKNALENL